MNPSVNTCILLYRQTGDRYWLGAAGRAALAAAERPLRGEVEGWY